MGLFGDIFGGGQASEAASEAESLQQRQYQDLKPWRRLGGEAIGDIRDIYLRGTKPYTESPGYQFRKEEATRGLDRFLAARGLSGSGRAVRGGARLLDNLATSEYDQGLNRLAMMAGLGGQGQQMSGQALGRQAGYALAGGQARQSGYDRASGAGVNLLAGLAGQYF